MEEFVIEIFDYLYFKLRKKQLLKAQTKLKKITIGTVFKKITNACWYNNVNYNVILKNSKVLIIILFGTKNNVLIRYHKKNIINVIDYKLFLNEIENQDIKKAIYITTGEFNEEILKYNSITYFNMKIRLEDSKHFLKNQLGIGNNCSHMCKKLNFYRYIPN